MDKDIELVTILKYRRADMAKYKPELLEIDDYSYNSLLENAKKDAESKGLKVKIIDFKPLEYENWLKKNNEKDTPQNRNLWSGIVAIS